VISIFNLAFKKLQLTSPASFLSASPVCARPRQLIVYAGRST
jgi:hypothetical protein